MADYFNISGDKDDIYSCIDFYQNLTVVGLNSLEELRKQHMEMYLNDYMSSCPTVTKPNTVEAESKEYTLRGIILEDLGESDYSSSQPSHKEGYENTGVLLEDYISSGENDSSNTNIEYVPVGVLLDDGISSNENGSSKKDIEYVSVGVLLEDVVFNKTKDVSEDDSEDFSNLFIEEENDSEDFSNLFIEEDIGEELSEDNYEDFSNLFVEEDDAEEENIGEKDTVEKGNELFEDNSCAFSNLFTDEDTNDSSEDNSVDCSSSSRHIIEVSSSYSDGFNDSNRSIEELSNLPKSDSKVNIDVKHRRVRTCIKDCDSVSGGKKDRIVNANTEKTLGSKQNIPSKMSSVVDNESTKKSYKNVRDFVKQNPGCSMSDARKYFSSKEIQKALIGSKIAEKRNKLYVI